MDRSDAELIRQAREGDTGSYAVLVERYYPSCLRFGVRMLGNRLDAEEATQDAFVRAYRSLCRYQDRDRFSSWLFRILVNQCRSMLRRQRRRERGLVSYDEVDQCLDAAELREPAWGMAVQRALQQLTPPLRETLLLRYAEGLSYDEIAEITGAGVSAVKMRVKRARDQLRELLQERCSA